MGISFEILYNFGAAAMRKWLEACEAEEEVDYIGDELRHKGYGGDCADIGLMELIFSCLDGVLTVGLWVSKLLRSLTSKVVSETGFGREMRRLSSLLAVARLERRTSSPFLNKLNWRNAESCRRVGSPQYLDSGGREFLIVFCVQHGGRSLNLFFPQLLLHKEAD